MRKITEHIKENSLIIIIKLSIICLFIYSLIYGISNLIDHYYTLGDWKTNKLTEYFQIATNNYYLRPSLILLIPIIGIFANKKIGWILILSYFYFLISNLAYPATLTDLTEKNIIAISISLLLLMIIILMNKKKISNNIYGIKKVELIKQNIIASLIGISITIILIIIKNNGI